MQHWIIDGMQHRHAVFYLNRLTKKYSLPFSFSILDSPNSLTWTGETKIAGWSKESLEGFLLCLEEINKEGVGVVLDAANRFSTIEPHENFVGIRCLAAMDNPINSVLYGLDSIKEYVDLNHPDIRKIQQIQEGKKAQTGDLIAPFENLFRTGWLTSQSAEKIVVTMDSTCFANCEGYPWCVQSKHTNNKQQREDWDWMCLGHKKDLVKGLSSGELVALQTLAVTFPEFQILKQNGVQNFRLKLERTPPGQAIPVLLEYVFERNGLSGLLEAHRTQEGG